MERERESRPGGYSGGALWVVRKRDYLHNDDERAGAGGGVALIPAS